MWVSQPRTEPRALISINALLRPHSESIILINFWISHQSLQIVGSHVSILLSSIAISINLTEWVMTKDLQTSAHPTAFGWRLRPTCLLYLHVFQLWVASSKAELGLGRPASDQGIHGNPIQGISLRPVMVLALLGANQLFPTRSQDDWIPLNVRGQSDG